MHVMQAMQGLTQRNVRIVMTHMENI